MGCLGVLFLFSLSVAATGVKQYLFPDSGKWHCIVSLEETGLVVWFFFPKTFTFLDGLHHVLGIAFKGSLNSGQALPACSRGMLLIKTSYAHHAEIY